MPSLKAKYQNAAVERSKGLWVIINVRLGPRTRASPAGPTKASVPTFSEEDRTQAGHPGRVFRIPACVLVHLGGEIVVRALSSGDKACSYGGVDAALEGPLLHDCPKDCC